MALNIGQAEKTCGDGSTSQPDGQAVGVVGFCMGGALSSFAACANGTDVGACVIYYGGHQGAVRLRPPDRAGPRPRAERDDAANANAARIEAALKQRGKSCEFHRYPGTRHAFFNDARPEVYDAKAAQLSWQRSLAFFNAHL